MVYQVIGMVLKLHDCQTTIMITMSNAEVIIVYLFESSALAISDWITVLHAILNLMGKINERVRESETQNYTTVKKAGLKVNFGAWHGFNRIILLQ